MKKHLRQIANEISSGTLGPDQLGQRVALLLKNDREISRVIWIDASGVQLASSPQTTLAPADLPAASRAGRRQRAQIEERPIQPTR